MSYTAQQILQATREEFHDLLGTKTSWGRNEVEALLERAISDALLRFVE